MKLASASWPTMGIAFAATLLIAACTPMETAQQPQQDDTSLRELVANDRQQIDALQQQVAQENDRIAELEHNLVHPSGASNNSQPPVSQLPPAPTPNMPAANNATPGVQPSFGVDAGPNAEASPGADDNQADSAQAGTGSPPAEAPPADAGNEGSGPSSSQLAAAAPITPPAPETAPRPTESESWQDEARQQLASAQDQPGERLYHAGLADLTTGRYAQGLAKLQDLQKRYPKSDLSEPAEYFSGIALSELGQHEKAILQYNDVTMRFPEGKYASAALLHEAQAFTKINDPIDARLTLQKLLSDHPNAPEAPMAKSMMASLSS